MHNKCNNIDYTTRTIRLIEMKLRKSGQLNWNIVSDVFTSEITIHEKQR